MVAYCQSALLKKDDDDDDDALYINEIYRNFCQPGQKPRRQPRRKFFSQLNDLARPGDIAPPLADKHMQ